MHTNNILIGKFNPKKDSFDNVVDFYGSLEEAYGHKYDILLAFDTWKVKRLGDESIYIKLNKEEDLDISDIVMEINEKNLGDKYSLVTEFFDVDII